MREYLIHSPYKPMVKSTRYKWPMYTARTLFKNPTLRDATLQEVINVVKRECDMMCKVIPSPSMLRSSTISSMKEMQWEPILADMKVRAPVLLSILSAAASRHLGDTTKTPSPSIIAMAASVLLKSRSNNICKVQAMIGALLYAGHASKRVCAMLVFLHYTLNRVIDT